jgi:pyruvate carboxylase subunit A
MREIKKILIANRGEIALRVVKSCMKMGIKTVGIFSEADKDSPLLEYVDEQILIGPAPSNKSYLNQDLIIKKSLEMKVDAIHPGYGFLSENASFAEKVIKAGIIFIGPSPKSIEIMGDKLSAKKTVSKFDIPLVPGLNEEIKDVDKAMLAAEKIGFPVLIKASAGGGGKGMRIVHEKENFKQQMKRAVSEAENSFGNGAVFIEKYLSKPRHIEIQILADQHGNVVHLFERDCSIQRRHQKIVEEAPSAVVSEKLREIMGDAACNVARSCNYHGAGTVEFIFENNSFYFLEMNTRLQVEHPVTEMITGLDLVEEQINIAKGEKLTISQKDLKINGHAIEIRVCANI